MSRSYNGTNPCTTEVHHKKPRSLGGGTNARNCIRLLADYHHAWHRLFFNWTPEQIAHAINNYYLDPDYEMICVKKGTFPHNPNRYLEEGTK